MNLIRMWIVIQKFILCTLFKIHRCQDCGEHRYRKSPGVDERNRLVRIVRRETDQQCAICDYTRTLTVERRVTKDWSYPERLFR